MAILVALVEVLFVSVCVVVLKAALLPLDRFHRALARLMAVLGDYHEARLSPLTSVSAKVESWEVMALLPPLVVGLTEAAPLFQMLLVRLAPISSQDALVSPGETTLASFRWESPVTHEEKAQAQHSDHV